MIQRNGGVIPRKQTGDFLDWFISVFFLKNTPKDGILPDVRSTA